MARYKAKANNKLIIALGCVVLAAALTIAAAIGSLGFTKKDVKTWFNNWGKSANSQSETRETWGGVIDNVGNELNAETTYAMPAAMAFYASVPDDVAQSARLASPGVTVTCSHNFEFSNVLVDWSVEYPSGASAADIVTVTPTGDGSLTANINCSAPFDTQLTLKATLRGNERKTATCTIDFMKRIEYLNFARILGWKMEQIGGIQIDPVFGIGTVEGLIHINEAYLQITDDFQKKVKYYLKFNIDFKPYCLENYLLDNEFETYFDNWSYEMFIQDFDSYDEAHKNAIYYAWYTAGYDFVGKNNISIDLNIDLSYKGKYLFNFIESNYLGETYLNRLGSGDYAATISPDLTLNTNVAL